MVFAILAIGVSGCVFLANNKKEEPFVSLERAAPKNTSVVLYIKPSCPYCMMAQSIFGKKDILYKTIDISFDDVKIQEMVEKSKGRRTVPQIFINDHHIGGYDDLLKLDKQGELDRLLIQNENE
jgi:glutaredoxin 3